MVPTLTLVYMEATGPMELTLTLIMASTTARGPLRLSPPPLPSPMLMPTTTEPTVWGDTEDTLVCTTTDTLDTTVWATEATGDKFSAVESTKQKLKANITPC